MDKYIKSILWLLGGGALSFGLLKTLTPNEEYRNKIRNTYASNEKFSVETQTKKQQFLDTLKAVSETNKPLHRLTKEELKNLKPKE